MIEKTLAKRYALGLLNTAKEKNAIEAVKQELDATAKIYAGMKDFRSVLAHPRVPLAEKQKLFTQTLSGKIAPYTMEFLLFLLRKRRVNLLVEISEQFNNLADAVQNIVRVKVTSAFPLTEQEITVLKERLTSITAKNIVISAFTDSSIIGGLTVRIGDDVVDASIAGGLKQMREQLLDKL
ncbi:MAG: ATP synthase F1 subunit delta [Planctomycetes bacterium]|nr:ATP synthase F1 subunit delta [Planctomycetota bacterium]